MFTTFEGDNHVLTQLVAKELLTAYADDIKGMSPVEWVRFAANFAGERVMKRTAAQTIMQTILDTRQDNEEEGSLFNRGTQVKMFEDREEYMLASVARRLQGKSKEMSPFDAFNAVQDHVLHAAQAHIDRIILEAFVAGIDSCEDDEAREILEHGVRPLRAVGDRGGQGVVHRAPLPVHRARQGRHPRHQRTLPQSAAARRDCWSTGSGSPSSCATPRCCTRRTSSTPEAVVGGGCQTRHHDRSLMSSPAARR